jgi:hypothetical protein
MGCTSSSQALVKQGVVEVLAPSNEKQMGIVQVYYFGDYWGRYSAIQFMLEYKNLQVEKVGLSIF